MRMTNISPHLSEVMVIILLLGEVLAFLNCIFYTVDLYIDLS